MRVHPIRPDAPRGCKCANCLSPLPHPAKREHHELNLMLSRMNEQQRRWVAAREANRLGHGGIAQVATITGLDYKTIKAGQDELANDLKARPTERIRLLGGGRKLSEKKSQN